MDFHTPEQLLAFLRAAETAARAGKDRFLCPVCRKEASIAPAPLAGPPTALSAASPPLWISDAAPAIPAPRKTLRPLPAAGSFPAVRHRLPARGIPRGSNP